MYLRFQQGLSFLYYRQFFSPVMYFSSLMNFFIKTSPMLSLNIYLQMYKIKKCKHRSPKQLFHLLKSKIILYCRSLSKTQPQVTYIDILFPITKQKNIQKCQEIGQPCITKKQLQNRPYINYDFPLQTYNIKLTNYLFCLLQPETLLKFSQTMIHGKPSCLVSSQKGELMVVGTQKGTVMLVEDITKKKEWKIITKVFKSQVVCLDIHETFICGTDFDKTLILFEKMKIKGQYIKITEVFTSTQWVTFKMKKYKDDCLIYFTDIYGSFGRIWIKKWLMVRRTDEKSLYKFKENSPYTKLKILPRTLSNKYYYMNIYQDKNILAFANPYQVGIVSHDIGNDCVQKLFFFVNPHLILTDRYMNSLEFIQGHFGKNTNQSLLLASGFQQRLYFIHIWINRSEIIEDEVVEIKETIQYTVSKRLRFPEQIVQIISLDNQRVILISRYTTVYYCYLKKLVYMDRFTSISDVHPLSIKCNGIIRYKNFHIEEGNKSILKNYCVNNVIIFRNAIFMIENTSFVKCTIMNWKQLYDEIKYTETLQLLKFLILLKTVDSPFLSRPDSFEGLEKWFPCTTSEQKLILLEYYYQMQIEPPENFAEEQQLNQLLLPFIFRHQIKTFSDELLDSMVSYWEKQNYLVVQEIIMSEVNKGWETAIKNAWLRALVKMVQMGAQYDFPLLKMYGYVVMYQKKDQKITKKYVTQIIKYIQLGLNRRLKNQLTNEEYFQMVQLFVQIIFQKDLFEYLQNIKPKKLIRLLTIMFTKQSKTAINNIGLKSFVLKCNKKYHDLQMMEQSTAEILYSHSIQNLFEKIEQLPEGSYTQSIRDQIIIQQAIMIHQWEYGFKKERMLVIIKRILQNERLLTKIHDLFFCIKKKKQQASIQIQQFIIDLIQILTSTYCITDEQKRQIIFLAERTSEYDYITIKLVTPLKKFEAAIAKFINSKNPILKQRIFQWLEQTINKCRKDPDPKVMEQFNRVAVLRTKDCIQINKQKTRDFVSAYYKNSEKRLISRLEDYPQLQLQYVQLLIHQSREAVEQYLLNLHISLLCKLVPSKIIPVLQQYSNHDFIRYSLEDALNLCKQHQINEAIIYITQKTGQINKALTKHLQVFVEEWQKFKKSKPLNIDQPTSPLKQRNTTTIFNLQSLISKMSTEAPNTVQMQESLKNEQILYDHLEYMLELIHKQPRIQGYFDHYSQIITVFMKIYETQEMELRSVRNKNDESNLNKISDLIGLVILDLARQGDTDYLIDHIILKHQDMTFREMKKHFENTYKTLISSEILLINIIEVIKLFLIGLNHKVRGIISKSIACEGICNLCGIPVDQNLTLVFECGHIFHIDCISQQEGNDYCFECAHIYPIASMVNFPELNLYSFLKDRNKLFKQKATNQRSKNQQKIQQQQQNRVFNKRMNKMKIYDKKQQELLTEAETIELRLELKRPIQY